MAYFYKMGYNLYTILMLFEKYFFLLYHFFNMIKRSLDYKEKFLYMDKLLKII